MTDSQAPLAFTKQPIRIDFSLPMFSKLTAAQRELLLLYYENYLRLVEFYDNCRMTVREDYYSLIRATDAQGLPPPPERKLEDELQAVKRYVYYGSGGNRFRLDRNKCDPSNPSVVTESYTGIITPSDSYILQPSGTGRFSVRQRKKMGVEDLERLASYLFVTAPYAYNGEPLQDILFQKPPFCDGNCRIEDIALASQNGQKTVVLSLSGQNKRARGDWVFQFLPDSAWALQDVVFEEIDIEKGESYYEHFHCVYRQDSHGVPILSEMVKEAGKSHKEEPIRLLARYIYTVESFVAGPADLSHFDVPSLVGDNTAEVGRFPCCNCLPPSKG